MPLDLEYAAGSNVTVSTTEKSLSVDGGDNLVGGVPFVRTDAGVFDLWLNTMNMAKGDIYEVNVYEKAVTGDTQHKAMQTQRIAHAQSSLFVLLGLKLGIGWDITIKKVAGTDRAFYWSIRRVH